MTYLQGHFHNTHTNVVNVILIIFIIIINKVGKVINNCENGCNFLMYTAI